MFPLFRPLLALLAGIVISPCLDPFAVWVTLPVSVFIGIAKPSGLFLSIMLLGAGLRSLEPPVPPDPGDAPVRLVGTLRRSPDWRGLGVYLDVEVHTVDGLPYRGRARLTEFLDDPEIRKLFDTLGIGAGDRLEIVVKLSRPVVYRNPGVFDFRRHLERQGIYWTGNIRNPRLITVLEKGSWRWAPAAALDNLRAHLRSRLSRAFATDPITEGLVMGMVLGVKSGLTAETELQFQASGLYHLLVVSGFNLAIIAGAAMRIARWTPLNRRQRLVAVLTGALAYAAIVDGQAPVTRAGLMVCFMVVGRMLDRGYSALNSAAAAAFTILLVEPTSLEDPSFQMTFAAVFSIAGIGVPAAQWAFGWLRQALMDFNAPEKDGDLLPAIADWRVSRRLWCEYHRLPLWSLTIPWNGLALVGEIAIISFCVEIVFTFFMVESFHRIVPISPLLNIPAALITALITPMGLLILAAPGTAAAPIAWLIQRLLTALLWLIDSALQVPFATLRVPSAPVWLWMLYLIAAGILCCAIRNRRRNLCLVCLIAVSVLKLFIAFGDFSHPPPDKTTLTFLDVGQGDSTLVELKGGQRVLIDGGGIAAGRFLGLRDESTFSTGEDVVSPYLFHRRVRRLDTVILTHAHNDHIDGLNSVVENFVIGEFWLGRNPMTPAYRELVERIQKKQIPIRWVSAGDLIGPFTVLHPPQNWRPRKTAQNDDSIVLLLESDGLTALLTGDIERRIPAPEHVDVLKVSHHGSRGVRLNSQGTVRVVSVGANNPFGHPHPSVLPALRTDRLGSITVTLSENGTKVASALTSACASCRLAFLLSGH